ncbi:hypothetical protein V5O48_017766, partial [Marasmius crinis-equi]
KPSFRRCTPHVYYPIASYTTTTSFNNLDMSGQQGNTKPSGGNQGVKGGASSTGPVFF